MLSFFFLKIASVLSKDNLLFLNFASDHVGHGSPLPRLNRKREVDFGFVEQSTSLPEEGKAKVLLKHSIGVFQGSVETCTQIYNKISRRRPIVVVMFFVPAETRTAREFYRATRAGLKGTIDLLVSIFLLVSEKE